MNQQRLLLGLILVALIFVVASATVYTVDQRETALVLHFGEVTAVRDRPGIYVKIPFVDNVRYFDARLLTYDTGPIPVQSGDDKSALVDAYVEWHIADPRKFYVSLGTVQQARTQLGQVANSRLRDEFGTRPLQAAIAGDRDAISGDLRTALDKAARDYGIEVVDARIQRIALAPKLEQRYYSNMKAEQASLATQIRAEGAEAADEIRADADRQRAVILAQAYRDAERIRGEGDARAAAIYARAYGKAPEFAAFYRSLKAYRDTFKSKSDVLVVDPSADFFKYLQHPQK